jgi:hypothetical protein
MKARRKFISLLLTAAMVLALGPVFTQDAWAGGIPYIDEYGKPAMADVVTWITDQTELVAGWYVVSGNVPIGSRIILTGDVHLILEDGCELTASEGINVAEGYSLTIYGQSGSTGKLTSTGNSQQAGIGGGGDQANGTITINGGTVTANGGDDFFGSGAGIGGGYHGAGGTVTINGGTIDAQGGIGGAGIGGGISSPGGEITIKGGTVTVIGGANGAGIGGGGGGGSGNTITNTGGTIKTKGGDGGGAGIGGGYSGAGGVIIINGGTIDAQGSTGGAGIGGGPLGSGGTITITDSTVNATGDFDKGIGDGDGGAGGTLDIENAIVFASSVTAATSGTNAILVEGVTTTFCGGDTVILDGDYIIPAYKTLKIDENQALVLANDSSLTVTAGGAVTGTGSLTGEGTLTNNGSVAISLASVTDNNESYTYNGGAIIPDLTVQIAGTTLIQDTDYGVSASSNTDAGTASYIIAGLGHFTVTKNGSFTIGMGTPEIITQPTATSIYNGMSLSSSALSGGAASVGEANVPGTFVWTTGAQKPDASGNYSVTFTPDDAANYKTALGTTHVTVIVLNVAELSALIEIAKTKVAVATYGDKHGDYPETAKINLTAAINAATTTVSAIGIPQEDITDAADILDTAIATFDAAKVVVNFTGLKAKIDEANAISRGNYTAATWETLQTAILNAEAIIDGYVTQDETNNMTEALTGAITGLVNNTGGGNGSTGNNNTTNPTPPSQAIPGGGTVTAPAGKPPVSNPDGSVTLPGGGTVATPGGVTVSVPEGSIIDKDGNTTVGVSGGSVSIPSGVTIAVPGGSVVTPGESVSLPQESGASITLEIGLTFNTPAGAEIVFDEDAPLGYRVDAGNPFADVKPNDWFYGDAMFAYSHGLMAGMGAEEYSPKMPTTRGMVVAVLHRLESEPNASTENIFSDVANEEYYTKAVTWAAGEGIVEGYGDEIFRPNFDITRQELAAVLLRLANHKGLKLPAVREYAAFADDTNVSGYARTAVETLYKAGILSGKPDNLFDPKGPTTRAEAAAILHRFLESAEK